MSPDAEAVCRAFGLRGPVALLPYRHGGEEAWRLETGTGTYLVKRPAARPGRLPRLYAAMEIERRARDAGIAMRRPVEPVEPACGLLADTGDGLGPVRVYEWLDGSAPDAGDDISAWLGTVLAALHSLHPAEAGDPDTDRYGVNPSEAWQDWLSAGLARRLTWAPVLKARMGVIVEMTGRIEAAFRDSCDHVLTHRDVVPRNVLMVPGRGPVLVDWDTAGPDCATLEAAHAFLSFALRGRTDLDRFRLFRSLAAYRDHGGRLAPSSFVLARRQGRHLATCAEMLRISLGRQPAGSIDPAEAEARATDQLTHLPALYDRLQHWSDLLDTTQ